MSERAILFATDHSDASRHAFPFACELAHDLGARLVVAHVSEHELQPVGEAASRRAAPSPQEMEQLRDFRPIFADVACDYRLLYGPPSSANTCPEDEILRFADEVDAYAIVVGTHGRSGLRRALLGSSAEALLRKSRRPVVTVRCPQRCERDAEEEEGA